jgi:gas vesicle protein GvpN
VKISELTALRLTQKKDFVQTEYVRDLTERALDYLGAGYPVHFSGPAGTGKTTLAMHVAAQLGRPVIMIHGDDEFGSSDLIGGQLGFRSTKVVDNYIHSVLKQEENVSKVWVDNRLATACKFGFTMIYDEFNRSRPEANNVLLTILEERLLGIPAGRGCESFLQVHPDFSAIFTSNPEEYAGVHKTPDALADRLITIRVGHHDRETEVAITAAKSGMTEEEAARIVDVVRTFRELGANNHRPTVRACVMIAKVVALRGASASATDPVFRAVCRDVLNVQSLKVAHDGRHVGSECLDEIINDVCSNVDAYGRQPDSALASAN